MRRIRLAARVLLVAAVIAATAAATAHASAPTVTLSDPANGSLITGGQPTFSGSAGNSPADSGTVAIDVYSGSSASGNPVQILNTAVSNGTYSAKAIGLPDGTYTAVASESDNASDVGTSGPVTFQLFNASPQLTLMAPAAPITTPEPTFTGTAETGSGDSTTVELIIYPGTSTDATPMAVLSATVQPNGAFSVPVSPGLVNGIYTAVASQQLALSTTFSPTSQFTVSASTTTLAVTAPTADATEPTGGVLLRGTAADDPGDAGQVDLTLYRGATTAGTPVGTATAPVTDSSWNDDWGTTLATGTYTLVVTQAGSSATTKVTRTFSVVSPGSPAGAVTISAAGKLRAKLACRTTAGTCTGDLLIVTKTDLRTTYGGPLGPLRLMFAHYSVAAGRTRTLTAMLAPGQLAALRRAGATALEVTVEYPVGARLVQAVHSTAAVKVR